MAKKKADTAPRGFTKKQMEDALRAAGGIHTLAAVQLAAATGKTCSRSNISHYVAKHPEMRKFMEGVKEEMKDIAEAALIKNIRAGQPASVFFYLKTQAKDRGYVERSELTGAGGGAVKTETTFDLSKLTDNELNELSKLTASITGPA